MNKQNLTPFHKRLRSLVRERGLTGEKFEQEAGMDRRVLYRQRGNHRVTLMGLAYFFGMTVEELVAGTTAEEQWNER